MCSEVSLATCNNKYQSNLPKTIKTTTKFNVEKSGMYGSIMLIFYSVMLKLFESENSLCLMYNYLEIRCFICITHSSKMKHRSTIDFTM